jgi:hypothetical protein
VAGRLTISGVSAVGVHLVGGLAGWLADWFLTRGGLTHLAFRGGKSVRIKSATHFAKLTSLLIDRRIPIKKAQILLSKAQHSSSSRSSRIAEPSAPVAAPRCPHLARLSPLRHRRNRRCRHQPTTLHTEGAVLPGTKSPAWMLPLAKQRFLGVHRRRHAPRRSCLQPQQRQMTAVFPSSHHRHGRGHRRPA